MVIVTLTPCMEKTLLPILPVFSESTLVIAPSITVITVRDCIPTRWALKLKSNRSRSNIARFTRESEAMGSMFFCREAPLTWRLQHPFPIFVVCFVGAVLVSAYLLLVGGYHHHHVHQGPSHHPHRGKNKVVEVHVFMHICQNPLRK